MFLYFITQDKIIKQQWGWEDKECAAERTGILLSKRYGRVKIFSNELAMTLQKSLNISELHISELSSSVILQDFIEAK